MPHRCGGTHCLKARRAGEQGAFRADQAGMRRRGTKEAHVRLDCELEAGHEGDHRATLPDLLSGFEAVVWWERRREP